MKYKKGSASFHNGKIENTGSPLFAFIAAEKEITGFQSHSFILASAEDLSRDYFGNKNRAKKLPAGLWHASCIPSRPGTLLACRTPPASTPSRHTPMPRPHAAPTGLTRACRIMCAINNIIFAAPAALFYLFYFCTPAYPTPFGRKHETCHAADADASTHSATAFVCPFCQIYQVRLETRRIDLNPPLAKSHPVPSISIPLLLLRLL